MLARIDSRELTEWFAYAQVEPFGEARADLRAGIVASTVANTARDTKKRQEPFKPSEFMPSFEKESPEPDSSRMLHMVEMLNAAMGGKDLRVKSEE